MKSPSRTIAFVQPYVPSYRAPLFDHLQEALAQRDLEMEVWHAEPTGIAAARSNSVTGPWSHPVRQHRVSIGRRNLTYRPIARAAREVGGVVAGLASTNLETYRLAADDRVRLMLWGHGRNFTASNNALDSRLEGWLCARARHIFAYTDTGREHLERRGIPGDRLSTVRNSTDVNALRDAQRSTSPDRVQQLRRDLGVDGKRVGLFVGAFDESKRLPFLFEAADALYEELPDFHLIVAGAGQLEKFVRNETDRRAHISWIGRLDTIGLGELSKVAEVILMPGRVGLVAVDALALGIPLATTDWPFHAPEVEYLNASNSLRSADTVTDYAQTIAAYLRDNKHAENIRRAAWSDGTAFSVEESAKTFADGIVHALTRPRKY